MIVVMVYLLFLSISGTFAKPLVLDFDDTKFGGEEFEYFYNMELVEKLALLGEENTNIEFTIDELEKIIDNDKSNDTEVDSVLDKLLEEGNRIENVLNEFRETTANQVKLSENLTTELDFSGSLLYEILYWILLIFWILLICWILLISWILLIFKTFLIS